MARNVVAGEAGSDNHVDPRDGSTLLRPVAAGDGHAVACAVPDLARELAGDESFNYCDAFAVSVPTTDLKSAEAWAKAMFTPRTLVERAFGVLWAAVMAVQPPRTGKRVAVFRLVSPQPEAAVLAADSERYRVRLVVLASEGRVTFATFVQSRGSFWRHLLKPILVGHRRVAPQLMELGLTRTLQ